MTELSCFSDEEEEVEKMCQTVISQMEKTLGEPLQKYFWWRWPATEIFLMEMACYRNISDGDDPLQKYFWWRWPATEIFLIENDPLQKYFWWRWPATEIFLMLKKCYKLRCECFSQQLWTNLFVNRHLYQAIYWSLKINCKSVRIFFNKWRILDVF